MRLVPTATPAALSILTSKKPPSSNEGEPPDGFREDVRSATGSVEEMIHSRSEV